VAKRNDPKADRKRVLEDLKRQQRAKERRKTFITVGIASLLSLGLIAAVVVPAVLKDRRNANAKKAAAREAKKPLADFGVKLAAAECAEEKVDSPLPAGSQHVAEGQTVDYPATPPDGGEHTGTATQPIGEGFYTRASQPPPEHVVHSLEHGVVIGWYDKALPSDQVTLLQKIGAASVDKRLRFIAVPWERADFADNKHFVLTSWGHTQRCGKVSGEAIDAFVKKNADSADAPERGGGV
jgi:hypothetical protein